LIAVRTQRLRPATATDHAHRRQRRPSKAGIKTRSNYLDVLSILFGGQPAVKVADYRRGKAN
jgi:hypothetical protein